MPPLPSSTAPQSPAPPARYRRRIQAARLHGKIKRLHDELGLLLGQGDGLTHCPKSLVQRRAMLGSQGSRR
jgi:hypothetical protein